MKGGRGENATSLCKIDAFIAEFDETHWGKFSCSVFAGCNMGCAIFLFTGYCAAAWLRKEVQLDLLPHDVADGCVMLNSQTFSVLIVCNLFKVLMTLKDLFKV